MMSNVKCSYLLLNSYKNSIDICIDTVIHRILIGVPTDIGSDTYQVFTNSRNDYLYYKNNKFHREDGPAYNWGNATHWYLDGKLFLSKQEWFEALSVEQKRIAVWKLAD